MKATTSSTSSVASQTFAVVVAVIVGAWSLSNGMSPLNSSMVLLSGVMGRPPETITIRWNGVFALTTLALFCLVVYVLPV